MHPKIKKSYFKQSQSYLVSYQIMYIENCNICNINNTHSCLISNTEDALLMLNTVFAD